jgi:hypothetical protein
MPSSPSLSKTSGSTFGEGVEGCMVASSSSSSSNLTLGDLPAAFLPLMVDFLAFVTLVAAEGRDLPDSPSPSFLLIWPKRVYESISYELGREGEWVSCAYLGNVSILESRIQGDLIPVDVGLVLHVLDDVEEERGLLGAGFLFAGHVGSRER